MGLILNPMIHFKRSNNKIVAYKVNPVTLTPSVPYFIQSIFAVFLTLFDGDKPNDQVLKDFCFLLGKEYSKETVQWIESRLQNIRQGLRVENLLVEKSTLPPEEQKPRYNPMDLAIALQEEQADNDNPRLDFPLLINFNVTTKCKMACKYCFHPRYPMNEYIPLERLSVLFDECVENGCKMILLSGGDPFEHPEIINIMRLLKDKGLPYSISTKSYLDLNTCQRLKAEADLNLMQISLDSADPAMAAFLTGMDQGYFQRTIETIENLHTAGIKVKVRSVLTGYNADSIEELLHLCNKLNVEMIDISQYERSLWNHSDELFVTEDQSRSANQKIEQFKAEHPQIEIEHTLTRPVVISSPEDQNNISENRGVCSAGRSNLTLLPNGEVMICEYLNYTPEVILGDLRQQSIKEFWHSKKLSEFLAPPERSIFAEDSPCKTCADEDYNRCHKKYSRCYKYTLGYFKTLNAPDVRCKLAQVQDYRIC